MPSGLRIVSLVGLSAVVSCTAACEGTPGGRKIGVRPGTSSAQIAAAKDRERERDEGASEEVQPIGLEPAARPESPATGRQAKPREAATAPAPQAPPAPTTPPARPRGTPEAPRPLLDKGVPMTKTERTTLREQALGLLSSAAQAGPPEERANAIEALTATPARLAAVLEPALQDQNVGVRSVAAMAAGKARIVDAAGLIRPLLQDESRFVRSAAIYGLYKLGQKPNATPLAGMLFDPSPRVRAQAAFIMGEMGEKSALGPLREAAKIPAGRSSPGEVRAMDLQIAEARVKLGDESALADIRTALFPAKPEDLEASILAMQIIGQVRDRASANRLIELTSDKDPTKQAMPGEIRVAAAMALARLGQAEGSYIAREYYAGASEALRAQSAHLMGELGRAENLGILARMMDDPDGRVRVAAASAVVKVTDRE